MVAPSIIAATGCCERGAFSIIKAVDEVRRSEVKKLNNENKPAYLKKSGWLFLKKKKNLCGKARPRLRELLNMNLRTVKAYLFKEDFDHLWNYKSPA